MVKIWFGLAALSAGLAVGLGAFGAHALKARVAAGTLAPERLETWHTAAQYQMWHALALLVLALAAHAGLLRVPGWLGWGFLAGTLLFSGSLYALVLSGVGILGAITPLGGALWIVSWLTLAVVSLRG